MPLANAEVYLTDPAGDPVSGSSGLAVSGTVNLGGQVSVNNFPSVQAVSGGVVVQNWPSTVGISGSTALRTWDGGIQAISGTVSAHIQNWPAIHGVSGTVGINNFPGTQSVSGTVRTWDGGTQSISGTVRTWDGGIQAISGGVVIQNWPATIGISGSAIIKVWESGVEGVSGSQVTGSTFHGYPVVAGGVYGSGGQFVKAIQTDISGAQYITTSGSIPVFITGLTLDTNSGSLVIVGPNQTGSVSYDNPLMVAGQDSDKIVRSLAVDSIGRLITAPAGSVSTTSGFIFGGVATSGGTQIKVEGTTYTEQSSNAQRSVVSTSANDTNSAGTGARKVTITYYRADYSGPFTAIVNLAGTTPVNTTVTDICFIEKMEITDVGSTAANAGTISLKAATAGGGATIGSIGLNTLIASSGGDNLTFWAHHYVPPGKTCYITSVIVGHNNNTSLGSGGTFHMKSRASGSLAERQVTDFIHQFGQDSSTPRNYGTPIAVAGPARLTAFVFPDASLTVNYFFSFDFYEQ